MIKKVVKEDELSAVRGILNGLLIGLIFWGVIIGVAYFVSR